MTKQRWSWLRETLALRSPIPDPEVPVGQEPGLRRPGTDRVDSLRPGERAS